MVFGESVIEFLFSHDFSGDAIYFGCMGVLLIYEFMAVDVLFLLFSVQLFKDAIFDLNDAFISFHPHTVCLEDIGFDELVLEDAAGVDAVHVC